MIQIIWEFVVTADAVGQFEQAYGPGGAWVRLFQAHPGFRGTTLLRDNENPRRYVRAGLSPAGSNSKGFVTATSSLPPLPGLSWRKEFRSLTPGFGGL